MLTIEISNRILLVRHNINDCESAYGTVNLGLWKNIHSSSRWKCPYLKISQFSLASTILLKKPSQFGSKTKYEIQNEKNILSPLYYVNFFHKCKKLYSLLNQKSFLNKFFFLKIKKIYSHYLLNLNPYLY
jgi:hypothetical protein